MIQEPHTLLGDTFKRWRIGLLVAMMVVALIALALSIRPRFVAEAALDIGGTLRGDFGEQVQIVLFEGAYDIEQFYEHVVFAKAENGADNGFDGRCSAKALYSPNGLRLRMNCRGQSEAQVRELISSAFKPLLERHAHYYEIAKTIDQQRKNSLERQLIGSKQAIAALRKDPVSGRSQAQIIDYQLKIEGLREKMVVERLLGNRVSPTRFDVQGISVIDRKPGLKIWIIVVVLALFAGLFVSVFAAILKRLEQERHRHDA